MNAVGTIPRIGTTIYEYSTIPDILYSKVKTQISF